MHRSLQTLRTYHKVRRRLATPPQLDAIQPCNRPLNRGMASISMVEGLTSTSNTHLPARPSPLSLTEYNDIPSDLFPSSYIKLPQSPPSPWLETQLDGPRMMTYYDVEEQLATIRVVLHRDPIRAEQMFLMMWYEPKIRDLIKLRLNTPILNAILEAYVNKGNTLKVAQWEHSIANRTYGPGCDTTTYAILVGWHLSRGMVDHAIATIQEAEAQGTSVEVLRRDSRFTDPSRRTALEALLRQIGKVVDGYSQADSLLLSALEKEGLDREIAEEFATEFETVNEEEEELDLAVAWSTSQVAIASTATPATKAEARSRPSGLLYLQSVLEHVPATDASPEVLANAQVVLEGATVEAAIKELQTLAESQPSVFALSSQPYHLIWSWTRDLANQIGAELRAIESDTTASTKFATEHSFVSLINPQAAALIAISCAVEPGRRSRDDMDAVGGDNSSTRFARLSIEIGKACEREYNLQQASKSANRRWLKAELKINALQTSGRLYEMQIKRIKKHMDAFDVDKKERDWDPIWPDTVRVKVGAFLAGLLLKVAKVPVVDEANADSPPKMVPAFEHYVGHSVGSRAIGFFRPSEALRNVEHVPVVLSPALLPMLSPPRAWIGRNTGGYLTSKTPLVRIFLCPEHQEYIKAAEQVDEDGGHLKILMKGLDVLGQTPWRVNERVLDVVSQIWKDDKNAVAGLPAIGPKSPQPAKPSEEAIKGDPSLLKTYLQESKLWQNEATSLYSQRCSEAYKIEIAKAFVGHTVYFPHNVDFRGRAYPIPPHLNHMGNDLCRGIMEFAEAKPLGKRGLEWLKIQVATLAGASKVSFEDRIQFTEDIMKEVYDSADQPLTGNKWWMKSDEPLQLLATCLELAAAMRYEPSPELYPSRLPIHQDGTCNGLQHYAALGGDKDGAKNVNLIPSDKPQDVYSGVANLVAKAVETHAVAYKRQQDELAQGRDPGNECKVVFNGHLIDPPIEASWMQGRVTRSLVKQTVMTESYGVTFIGAREQVASRLKESREENNFTPKQIASISKYIARLIFNSLGELFAGAKAIQEWLNITAALVCKSIPETHVPPDAIEDAKILGRLGIVTPQAAGISFSQILRDNSGAKTTLSLVKADTSSLGLPDELLEDGDGEAVEVPKPVRKGSGGKSSKDKVLKTTPMIWTTPLGMPVVQPYRDTTVKEVYTPMQSVTLRRIDDTCEINPRKQSSAFPPNFVHSLDASHMILTAIACNSAKIRFASVHDSFWTHAADSDTLAQLLRQTFVRLHSTDILNRLAREVTDRVSNNRIAVDVSLTPEQVKQWKEAKGLKRGSKTIRAWLKVELPPVPERGDFGVDVVQDSKYFFH
ncbi:DNA-directed RNA polymerase [Synchytrium microbalum]|uniref:DNA-directed RNA polymerase n=1 Tax=Synchytrium microbalum TaxID=1806994 RepID=A0A507C547_9FUNG|nr:DNA-directed RNA polymerase [Synchytrium microbalum]TPX33106.1 DNA-directed RNA polymerase [Synchytrium microbalum]